MPAAPAAPPPSAPTPAAPAPAPAPVAATPEIPTLGHRPNMDAAWADLDKRAGAASAEPTTVPRHPAAKKPAAPPKPAETPPADETTPPPGEAVPPESETKPPENETTPPKTETAPIKPKKPADFLREELSTVKTENQTLKAELEKLRAAPAEAPEHKKLAEQYEQERQARAKLEDEMRFVNYEKSTEYQEKYHKPFIAAWQAGQGKMHQLRVNLGENPETGEMNTRPGTPEDFDAIMQAPNEEAAIEMIEKMFGSGSRGQIVTLARDKAMEANTACSRAIEDFKKTGGEREKQFREHNQKLSATIDQLWQGSIKPEAIPEQFRELIVPPKEDTEANALLEKGYSLYDRVARENARDPNLTEAERAAVVRRAATVRHRAAGFGPLAQRFQALKAEHAKLQEQLAQYASSEPGAGDGKRKTGTEATPGTGNTMDDAMGALDRMAQPVFH